MIHLEANQKQLKGFCSALQEGMRKHMLSAGIAKGGLAEMQFQVTVRQMNGAACESFTTAQAVKFVQPSLTEKLSQNIRTGTYC